MVKLEIKITPLIPVNSRFIDFLSETGDIRPQKRGVRVGPRRTTRGREEPPIPQE